MLISRATFFLSAALLAAHIVSAAPIRALIIDGQNNHDWKKHHAGPRSKLLEETGLFQVDVPHHPSQRRRFHHF